MDLQRQALTRDGMPVKLSPRLVQILSHLAAHRGDVVAKDALLDRYWANLHVAPNTLDRAITRIRQALGEDPHAPRFIQTVSGQGYRFVAAVDAGAAPTRRDGWEQWRKGRLSLEALDAGQLRDAARIFEGVLDAEPDSAAAHAALANACFLKYELTRPDPTPDRALLERAVTHAERACVLDPGLGEAWATLGYLLTNAGQVERARAAARRAVALQPMNWRHQFRLAMACWGQERLDAVDRTLALMPGFAPARFLAAMVFVARQAFPAAEELALAGAARQSQEAQSRNSVFPPFGLHWLLGLLQLRDGRTADAIESFERELDEGRPASVYFREYQVNALLGLGYAHLAAWRAGAAADAFRRALDIMPSNGRALLGLQQALARNGLQTDAELLSPRIDECLMQLASGGRPGDAAMLEAVVEASRGETAGACMILEKLLQQVPPGQAGWMIPIDPPFALLREKPSLQPTLALLSARAG